MMQKLNQSLIRKRKNKIQEYDTEREKRVFVMDKESKGGFGPCEKINICPAAKSRKGKEGRGSVQLSQ